MQKDVEGLCLPSAKSEQKLLALKNYGLWGFIPWGEKKEKEKGLDH